MARSKMAQYTEWVSPVQRMFDELPEEGQKEVRANIDELADFYGVSKDISEWDWLVENIHKKYNSAPNGWFKWWED